jgi:Predicted tagatose 6-phosphate kinase
MIYSIKEIVNKYKNGGIFSVCCSNRYLIEASMERLLNKNIPLL